jgi:hypothetical protein
VTFVQLQDDTMARLNLSSAEARTNVKKWLNQKYRRLVTGVGLGRVRRSTLTFVTVSTTQTYTPATLIKPFTVSYVAGNLVLDEKSEEEVRAMDPALQQTGSPRRYVVQKYLAAGVTLRIHPTPDAVYTITVDGLIAGTEMSADADVPAFPEDFHDLLVFGAMEEALIKLEKPALAAKAREDAKIRTSDLRYFLAKSGYLHKVQGSTSNFGLVNWRRWGVW